MLKLKTRYFLLSIIILMILTIIYLFQENGPYKRLFKNIEKISSFSTFDIHKSRSSQFYDVMDVISDSIIL
ncbi:hypothetical protein RclHR1_01020023 [Rhizophagus clarus]|uniref:Uncharacterized protein n=1 Tax=Rhizophagus clarus TaxID=94130 RepID=A0A2Z6Q5I8_9GLOM|nr:hypothetical protein RclHR1_01020023 [Rhizophagus clarus]